MRRVGVLAVGLAAAALLPACSPEDMRGIAMTDERVPVVHDCGTYITRVDAVDAAGHRSVWSAHVTPDVLEEDGGDAPVELGRLPDGWVEDSPLALAPRPATWLLTIETETGARDTIRVADDALEPGMMYRPRHRSVSVDEFYDRTCQSLGIALADAFGFVAVGGACIALASVVGRRLLRRQAARQAPAGGPPPPAPA